MALLSPTTPSAFGFVAHAQAREVPTRVRPHRRLVHLTRFTATMSVQTVELAMSRLFAPRVSRFMVGSSGRGHRRCGRPIWSLLTRGAFVVDLEVAAFISQGNGRSTIQRVGRCPVGTRSSAAAHLPTLPAQPVGLARVCFAYRFQRDARTCGLSAGTTRGRPGWRVVHKTQLLVHHLESH